MRCSKMLKSFNRSTPGAPKGVLTRFCTLVMVGVYTSVPQAQESAEVVEVKGPKMSVSTTEVLLGDVEPVDGAEYTVEVENQGDSVLTIENVVPLCTCLRSDVRNLVIQPGDKAAVTFQTFLAEYPSNEVKGAIRIRPSDSSVSEVDIAVRGNIIPEYVVDPPELDFGAFRRGESPTKTVELRPAKSSPVKLVAVESSQNLIVEQGGAGEDPGGGKSGTTSHQIHVRIADEAPGGSLNGSVVLLTDNPRIPRIEVAVRGSVLEQELTIAPKVLTFGMAEPGAVLGEFDVTCEAGAALEVSCQRGNVHLDVRRESSGPGFVVVVTAAEDAPKGTFVREIEFAIGEGAKRTVATARIFGRIN